MHITIENYTCRNTQSFLRYFIYIRIIKSIKFSSKQTFFCLYLYYSVYAHLR